MSNNNQNFSFIELDKLINENYSMNQSQKSKKYSSLIIPNEKEKLI